MKNLLKTVSLILLVTFTLCLVFVFQDDPDLWDKWHAEAMK